MKLGSDQVSQVSQAIRRRCGFGYAFNTQVLQYTETVFSSFKVLSGVFALGPHCCVSLRITTTVSGAYLKNDYI